MQKIKRNEPIRVLFVDDTEFLVELATKMIESVGCKCVSTDKPQEALEIFQKSPQDFDLVISDYQMPGLTGGELCLKIKEVRSDIPFALATASLIKQEEMDLWQVDYKIMKPYHTEDIQEILQHFFPEVPLSGEEDYGN